MVLLHNHQQRTNDGDTRYFPIKAQTIPEEDLHRVMTEARLWLARLELTSIRGLSTCSLQQFFKRGARHLGIGLALHFFHNRANKKAH